ncbi:MAG: hypothetical protein JSW11_12240 [Candidatus Heimdallarchaeota archaeon]|nr:MAG: hypothetical protein JSW11_12240 [Candidatus Heimdallarchaeota archaeon]
MKREIMLIGLAIIFIMSNGVVTSHPNKLQSINMPDFADLANEPSFTVIGNGVTQLNVTFKNTGDPATTGEVPIFWETTFYELELDEGNGTLKENNVDFDLNGDGDKTDSFTVTWTPSPSRPWDATIDGTYVYALSDHVDAPFFNRTYYINGKPKTFTLGSETHFLYMADSDSAQIGMSVTALRKHPSPNIELVLYSHKLHVDDFVVNGKSVERDFTRKVVEWGLDYETNVTLYVVPAQAFEIDSDEEVTFSCAITVYENVTCNLGILINWSPDGNIRYRWVPVYEEDITFEGPTALSTPGFSVLSLVLIVPLLLFVYRRKND